jgi:hypothetical protein
MLGTAMQQLFTGVEVIGCTTAGEIGPFGYREHSLVGVGFPAGSAMAVAGHLDRLQSFDVSKGRALIERMLQRMEGQSTDITPENSFAFLRIDGLSLCEETVIHVLQKALGAIPLIGDSAGDGLRFSETHVYHNGRFHTDSAVLALIRTPLPFNVFKTKHFITGNERLVVTEVDEKTVS